MVTSYNLLSLQEDLISGLKGSRIILYPISVCLCELTMASFWHDSIFFQFISVRLGRGSLEYERREENKSLRKNLLKEPWKGRLFSLLEIRRWHTDGQGKNEWPQSKFAFHFSHEQSDYQHWVCWGAHMSEIDSETMDKYEHRKTKALAYPEPFCCSPLCLWIAFPSLNPSSWFLFKYCPLWLVSGIMSAWGMTDIYL